MTHFCHSSNCGERLLPWLKLSHFSNCSQIWPCISFAALGTTQVLRHFSFSLIVGFSFSACPLSLANIKFKMPPSYYCELCVRLYQLSRAIAAVHIIKSSIEQTAPCFAMREREKENLQFN